MTPLPNELRGEASLTIGDVGLTIAVEFAGLARLSAALSRQIGRPPTLDDIYQGLLGFSPNVVSLALLSLVVHPEGEDKARELGAKAVARLTAADEPEWRKAVETALAAHIDAGRRLRGEPSLAEQAEAQLAAVSKKKPNRGKRSTTTSRPSFALR